ncbi:multiprotein-bridging factor 1 family protein [Saccharopolyspora cebuensis]|uniref:Multiprotein-bridging factor 1 family protein n=1 Tax=Saccharopolyspora cebuensis TaxID=418759 RepID=A0ABV4CQH3_9PSEU
MSFEGNDGLRQARLRTPSKRMLGRPMSQGELAAEVNTWLQRHTGARTPVDARAVGRWERGKVRRPNAEYRAALCAVLGCDEVELGWAPPPQRPAIVEEQIGPPRSSVVMVAAMAEAIQAADRKVGGGALYDEVSQYLTSTLAPRLLDPEHAGSPLFAAAASLAQIVGWMAHEAGQDVRARAHFDSAYRLALASGRGELVADVCGSMAHLATHGGEPAAAIRIAESGIEQARHAPGKTALLGRLHAMAARGYALGGDARRASVALSSAHQAVERASGSEAGEWLAPFDAASLAAETALCLLDLGELRAAEDAAQQVLSLRPPERVRSRALAQLTRARIAWETGAVDEAAALGADVCRTAPTVHSMPVRTKLNHLGSRMRPHHGVSEVAEFQALLSDLPALGHSRPREEPWPI